MTKWQEVDGPRAVDRKELAKNPPAPSDTWPRTDRRVARLLAALRRRQPDVAVVLEDVHDVYNVSAVLRTCDAVGVPEVHLVYTVEDPPRGRFARRVAAGTAKWVDTIRWDSIGECYGHLRKRGHQILATGFSDDARSIHHTDFTVPVAMVFGNEMRGLTQEAMGQADGEIYIPMMGMVQSLNISVSCAVTLYELRRQRDVAGFYASPGLS
ncbi:MAG: TrmH family RNA methyltransferase, partial [Thermomicrobiales bacterium]